MKHRRFDTWPCLRRLQEPRGSKMLGGFGAETLVNKRKNKAFFFDTVLDSQAFLLGLKTK